LTSTNDFWNNLFLLSAIVAFDEKDIADGSCSLFSGIHGFGIERCCHGVSGPTKDIFILSGLFGA